MSAKKLKPKCKICYKVCVRVDRIYCSFKCMGKASHKRAMSGKPCDLTLKRDLLQCNGNVCEICSTSTWQNKPVPIILDHIDGNSQNRKRTNLRLVCPNCDAQLPTFKGRNKGHGRFARRQRYTKGLSY